MQDNECYLPISFEYLMWHLFGKEKHHGYVGLRSKGTWKKDLKKIVKYLEKSICLNVVSDQHHKDELIAQCEKLEKDIEESTTIQQTNVAVIENLFKLSFQLLGNLPDHMEAKAPRSDKYWKLDEYRSLNYCQSDEQKTNLLLNLINATKKHPDDADQDRTLREIFGCQFKGNHSAFLLWFKSEYPEEYCRIF